MRKYALIDQYGTILSYSDFPIANFASCSCNDCGEVTEKQINCVPDVVYSPDYIGKTYDTNIKEVILE